MRFEPALEALYQADSQAQRRQFLTATGIAGALVYDLFLISDWLNLNDTFGLLVAGRLLLVTPVMIALLLIVQRLKSRALMEGLATFGTVFASLIPLLIMIHSESPHRLHYQFGMLLLMVYCAMIQQVPLRWAAAALTCMTVIQLVTTHVAGFMGAITWQSNALFFVSTAILLLMASYFMERGGRFTYLYALRGRLLQAQLTEMARTDPLTQLYNRRYQAEVLARWWNEADKAPCPVGVILLDIDHFKAYNDSYGHMQGDTCLKALSQAVQRTAQRAGALTFRFGGEEILVLVPEATMARGRDLAENLRQAVLDLKLPHPVMGTNAQVTISLGVATGTAPWVSADTLIARADAALYAAKHQGRNRLCSAEPELVSR
ncbi:GGDEF domain-containing protein [Pseudomonas massiliensis]|uniref:GGDEF domain-containing protein n=1 Tax=Pseudomonas massiliensis TaxID=522492 RepID=UPI00058AE603|nr:diguanylate cyclase [Pseudomonas massiliensis]